MSRRACRSRLALYAMIMGLVAANIFVLYCIYKKHHKTVASGDSDEPAWMNLYIYFEIRNLVRRILFFVPVVVSTAKSV